MKPTRRRRTTQVPRRQLPIARNLNSPPTIQLQCLEQRASRKVSNIRHRRHSSEITSQELRRQRHPFTPMFQSTATRFKILRRLPLLHISTYRAALVETCHGMAQVLPLIRTPYRGRRQTSPIRTRANFNTRQTAHTMMVILTRTLGRPKPLADHHLSAGTIHQADIK